MEFKENPEYIRMIETLKEGGQTVRTLYSDTPNGWKITGMRVNDKLVAPDALKEWLAYYKVPAIYIGEIT